MLFPAGYCSKRPWLVSSVVSPAGAEPIVGGRGRIKVGDTVWIAEGPDMPIGAHAKVTGTRGTVLVVERAAG